MSPKVRIWGILVCILVFIANIQGKVIFVDCNIGDDNNPAFQQYPIATIQRAIDIAQNGDIVLVAPGTYTGNGNRDIELKGKAVIVKSYNPFDYDTVTSTIIDCQGTVDEPHRAFKIWQHETDSTIIDGLTIINGYSPEDPFNHRYNKDFIGGGIFIIDSSPRIVRCVFMNNHAMYGGGIYLSYSNSVIRDCIFYENRAINFGGAIDSYKSNPFIRECMISSNHALKGGGGISTYDNNNLIIINSIFWGNVSPASNHEINLDKTQLHISYCDVEGGQGQVNADESVIDWGAGNIDADPGFVDAAGGDFHLTADSPCVNAGDEAYTAGTGEMDIDGGPRVSGGRIDIGPDEVYVDDMPYLLVEPHELYFTAIQGIAEPLSRTITIGNIGPGSIDFDISDDCDWLTAEPLSGQVAGDACDVLLTLDTSELAAGEYSCTVTITGATAGNSPVTVPVALSVIGPRMEISAESINFHASAGQGDPAPQSLVISNIGGGTMDFSVGQESPCSWLSFDPVSGSLTAGQSADIALTIDVSGLAVGQVYHNTLIVSSSAPEIPDRFISINLIFAGPAIWVSQEQLHFAGQAGGDNPAPQTLTVHNSEVGTLEFAVTSGCDWLKVDPPTGVSAGEDVDITVSIDATGLGRGLYQCNLSISSALAANNPVIIPVELRLLGTLHVPEEFGTIQAAINDAWWGESIIVAPGTYWENIHFLNRDINLVSTDPDDPAVVAGTVIRNASSGPVVAFGGQETENCRLAGFTITGGHNPGSGGGISGQGAEAVISHCRVIGNHADHNGGGIYDIDGAISACIISENIAANRGGGLASCAGPVINCLIYGNSCGSLGGALYKCNGDITNCTIAGNHTDTDHGVLRGCNSRIFNTIIWGNTPDDYVGDAPTLFYSCWPGANGENGNINSDPCFVDAAGGDFHLQSRSGHWNAAGGNWVMDIMTSKCIDAGNPQDSWAEEPSPNGHRINMGVYGGTNEASKTHYDVYRRIPDVNLDGPVTISITIDPEPSVWAFGVEETIPVGWTVTNISDLGHWDQASRLIKWGPYLNEAPPMTLTYDLVPEEETAGTFSVSGIAIFDGTHRQIDGDTMIYYRYHPADKDYDWQLTVDEVMAYGDCWKTNCHPISIDYVTISGYLNQVGGPYHFSGEYEEPFWWQPDNGGMQNQEPPAVINPTFSPIPYRPGSAVNVTLEVQPTSGTRAYALEDLVPQGWTVSAINGSGVWDADNGKVKWGPFLDDTARTLSYIVRPPLTATDNEAFTVTYSHDGWNKSVTRVLTVGAVGDINVDNKVDLQDFAILAHNWQDSDCVGCGGADLNDDHQVNLGDLLILANEWLASVQP